MTRCFKHFNHETISIFADGIFLQGREKFINLKGKENEKGQLKGNNPTEIRTAELNQRDINFISHPRCRCQPAEINASPQPSAFQIEKFLRFPSPVLPTCHEAAFTVRIRQS